MPTLNIQGQKVKVDDSFMSLSPEDQSKTVDEIASHLGIQPGGDAAAPADQPDSPQVQAASAELSQMTQHPQVTVDDAKAARDQMYSSGIYAGKYNPLGPVAKSLDAFSSGAQRAPLMGWDDEASAGLNTLGGAAGNYQVLQSKLDQQKAAQRTQNPVASLSGELAGGLAAGGTLASTGATLAGRSLPVIGRAGGAALEGAGYGAVAGAGEAKPGERAHGALVGAAIGAPIGAFGSAAVDALSSAAAKKAAQTAAPTVDELSAAAKSLYTQADQSGVVIKPQTVDTLANNMTFVAGRPNANIRPKTAGMVEDIQALKGQPLTIDRYHEIRQEIGLAMKNADPQDVRTLQRMKNVLDNFSSNAKPSDVTGNVQGFNLLKQADDVWSKKAKSQQIEDLFDLADVKSARYSQSGMANAVRDKASQLYTQIVKGKAKGFTAEETALIRKLSKGEMTPKVVNWVSKFAPRGVVSSGLGVSLGAALGAPLGPAGAALGATVPGAIGFAGAKIADRAAAGGLRALQAAAATGNAPILGAISNKSVPFLGGLASEGSSLIRRSR